MKKIGKYEAKVSTSGQRPVKDRSLLSTYFTSLLSLLLCVTMFLCTTFAWFTSEVTSQGNQVYIGSLNVDLKLKENDGWVSLKGDGAPKIFDSGIKWEPNYTAVETLQIVNQGDLAFDYELTIANDESSVTDGDLSKIAGMFTVYSRLETEESAAPASFADITEENGWTEVGTLADVLANSLPVFEGEMTQVGKDPATEAEDDFVATTHTYSIALHMSEEASGEDIMGKTLVLNVKLVAGQKGYEEDAFGPGYDAEGTVTVTPGNIDTIDFTQDGATYMLSGDFTESVTITLPAGMNQTFDGSDANFADGKSLFVHAPADIDNYAGIDGKERVGSYTIKNFKADSIVILTNNTTVNIEGNTAGAIAVRGGNVTVNVSNNTITADGVAKNIWNGQTTNYGFYLNAIEYDLSFIGNVVSGTVSNSVAINGRMASGEIGSTGGDAVKNNNNVVEFSGNKITVTGSKAAVKIWDDGSFAPVIDGDLTQTAKDLVELVKNGGNEITKGTEAVNFDFYNTKVEEFD